MELKIIILIMIALILSGLIITTLGYMLVEGYKMNKKLYPHSYKKVDKILLKKRGKVIL